MILEINTSMYEKLPRSFYERGDVVKIAKELLGMVLFTKIEGQLVAGRIVETEAYCGRGDKACHANNKRTPRTEVMYQRGGTAYVYLCYGIHHLFNVVTNTEGLADAVLIRALEPIVGMEYMKERRNHPKGKLTSGPGTLSQAMGIKVSMSGVDLTGEEIWIGKPEGLKKIEITEDLRIGVDYAEEDALRPWRFVIKDNAFASKKVKKKVR
ncbi:MAG: DNA-3-methyladenine glycosylase [Ekhidna sp.]